MARPEIEGMTFYEDDDGDAEISLNVRAVPKDLVILEIDDGMELAGILLTPVQVDHLAAWLARWRQAGG